MEIYQTIQIWVGEEEADLVYDHKKLILRDSHTNEYFFAIIKEPLRRKRRTADELEKLPKTPIPADCIWPSYSDQLSRAPEPASSDIFVKRAQLSSYGNAKKASPDMRCPNPILHEAEICELLKRHPHPNVAQYLGCEVTDNRITGLCFVKYRMTLDERLKTDAPFDKHACLQDIERGIHHLHSIGIVHNDINPSNIMVDELDRSIVIDFDSCQYEGLALGMKWGSMGYMIKEATHAQVENDFFSLSKIREHLLPVVNQISDHEH